MRKKANVESYLNNEMLATAVSNIRNNVDSTIKRTFTFKGRKSPEIIKAVINALTDEGDLVLDPFIGSGTTILASQKIRRKLQQQPISRIFEKPSSSGCVLRKI